MDTGSVWDWNLLVNELTQGQELTRQLKTHLDQASPSELCKSLAQKILSTLEKAISMTKSSDSEGERQPQCPNGGTESPRSGSGSPRSENSDRAFKDHERREMSKKRKTLPRWSSQVRVCAGAGVEGPLEDGHSWRKYGQKDILGAKFPRGYYRCTHRNSHGCLATKQVQRSDENPAIFDVTYRGTHTCLLQRPHLVPTSVPQEQKPNNPPGNDQHHQQGDQQLLLSFQTGLKVKTEGSDLDNHDPSSSFSFPNTPVSCVNTENHIFASPSTLDNHFMASYSPTFISPTRSDSNCFSMSPQISSYGWGLNVSKSESDLTQMIPAATSTTSSPMFDMDFTLESVEFDNFPFDASNFFS